MRAGSPERIVAMVLEMWPPEHDAHIHTPARGTFEDVERATASIGHLESGVHERDRRRNASFG